MFGSAYLTSAHDGDCQPQSPSVSWGRAPLSVCHTRWPPESVEMLRAMQSNPPRSILIKVTELKQEFPIFLCLDPTLLLTEPPDSQIQNFRSFSALNKEQVNMYFG
jgi:hypothetical protein